MCETCAPFLRTGPPGQDLYAVALCAQVAAMNQPAGGLRVGCELAPVAQTCERVPSDRLARLHLQCNGVGCFVEDQVDLVSMRIAPEEH